MNKPLLYGDLKEGANDIQGAMVCDYSTFRTIYRLNARAAVRHKSRTMIAMLHIINLNGKGKEMLEKQAAANQMGAILAEALRREDVVTGFDTTQYLILLSNIDAADAERVLTRLIEQANQQIGVHLDIETKLQALEPIS